MIQPARFMLQRNMLRTAWLVRTKIKTLALRLLGLPFCGCCSAAPFTAVVPSGWPTAATRVIAPSLPLEPRKAIHAGRCHRIKRQIDLLSFFKTPSFLLFPGSRDLQYEGVGTGA